MLMPRLALPFPGGGRYSEADFGAAYLESSLGRTWEKGPPTPTPTPRAEQAARKGRQGGNSIL